MVTFATLRTRLADRLSMDTVSTAESAKLDECLNAAIAIELANSAPARMETYSGNTLTALSTTVTAHSSASANVTLNSVTGVYPGDFFTVDSTGVKYLIRTVNSSTKVVNVGIPIAGSLNGLAVTVTRRSLELPHAGQVYELRQEDAASPASYEPLLLGKAEFDTGGTVIYYRQGYAENLEVSYVNLIPAPTASRVIFITQARAQAEDAALPASEGMIQAILATAALIRRLYSQGGSFVEAANGVREMTKHLRHEVGAASGVFTK